MDRFYQYAVHIAFGVVIAQSFYSATQKFIPFSQLLTFNGTLLASSLVMAYFIIITSWIGYYKSIKKSGYTETKLGATRFGMDFLILFVYYYFISLLTADIKPNPAPPSWMNVNYYDVFVWLMPILFAIYWAWDIVKFLEYRCDSKKKKQDRRNRMVITIIFFWVFVAQSAAYQFFVPQMELKLGGYVIWDFVFMVLTTVAVLAYRRRKILPGSGRVKETGNNTGSKSKKQKELTN
jgi:hypothetical protein